MANFDVFNDKFAALFRKRITSDDGGQFWEKFVANADWAVLEHVMDEIAEHKERERRANNRQFVSAPGLTEVKTDYFSKIYEAKEAERKARGVGGRCGFCQGYGWLWVLIGADGWAVDVKKPFRAPAFSAPTIAACCCEHGQRWEKGSNYNWRKQNAKFGYPSEVTVQGSEFTISGADYIRGWMKKNWMDAPRF
jgi:hypothetical protein